MAEIPFTKYLIFKSDVSIERPDAIVEKAKAIIAKGFHFECEMLSDYKTVSLTISDPEKGEDLDIVVIQNGPAVLDAIDQMVERFFASKRMTQ